jgi:hypothetical protein
MPTVRALLLAGLLVTGTAVPALAQDASPLPIAAVDMCALMTVDEAAAIPPGIAWASAAMDAAGCTYATADGALPVGAMSVGLADGDAGMVAAMFGAEETTIAGRPAWVAELGAFVALASRHVAITGFVLDLADPVAYWAAVGEIVVPRIPAAAWGAAPEDLSAIGPVCPFLDAATVGAALGLTIERAEGDATGCTYTTAGATLADGGYVTVNVRIDPLPLAPVTVAFPDGEALEVDGRSAWWSPSIAALWVDRDGTATTTVQFVLTSAEVATREHAIALAQALAANGG